MTKKDFLEYAQKHQLSCGSHFVIYHPEGIVHEYHILADRWNCFHYVHKKETNAEYYFRKYMIAMTQKTTLHFDGETYEKPGCVY